jgi:hypothetical protein
MSGSLPTVLLVGLVILFVVFLLLVVALLYFQLNIIRLLRFLLHLPGKGAAAVSHMVSAIKPAKKNPQPAPPNAIHVIKEAIKVSKLITFSFTDRIETEFESYPEAHWTWKWLVNRRETFSVTGNVIAVFDLLKVMDGEGIEARGRSVVITVPECELRVSIDEQSLVRHKRKRGVLPALAEENKRFDSNLRLYIEGELKKAAREQARIEEKALESLSEQLTPFLARAGFTDVRVVTSPHKHAVISRTTASLPPSP